MINKSIFGIPVEIDEAATAQWYSKQESWGCECADCRNFVALANQKKLPEQIHSVLSELKIDAHKATYVCEIIPKDNGHLYQFSYRIAGNILNEDDVNSATTEWGDIRCCHEPYPYGAPDFPTPHFDLEFWVTLPWVFNENRK